MNWIRIPETAAWARAVMIAACILLAVLCLPHSSQGQTTPMPFPQVNIGLDSAEDPGRVAVVLEIFLLMTVLSLAPAILVMLTSFTRVVVVLSILRQAMGTQQMPPNQVVIGLAIFLTMFIMQPVATEINTRAFQPYLAREIPFSEALERASQPVRTFMSRQTREKDIALFVGISKTDRPQNIDEVSTFVLIPSFIISELKTAFQIAFLLYIPFLIIDMIVASVLLSMGMMMLPPVMISLPFKMILFVLADGWNLIVGSLVRSFG
jgi:flagellar biosynthetic protein FliP